MFQSFGVDEQVEAGLGRIEVLSGGRVYAYASNVDSATGDGEFIPAMRE